jgi:hypothetical protein
MFESVDTTDVDELLHLHYRHVCGLRQEHISSAPAVHTQYSRLHEKVKCTALILAIADSHGGEVKVKPEHVTYATHYQMQLITTVLAHLSGGALSSPMEACMLRLEKAVERWPRGKTDTNMALNVPKRITKKNWLSKVFDIANCRPFKELTDVVYRGKTPDARKAIINEAIDKGLLVYAEYDGKQAFKLPVRK